MRRILIVALMAAPCAIGTTAAHGQVLLGDVAQGNNQSITSDQDGGKTQNSGNAANSTQTVDAQLIVGDVGQSGEQTIGSKQNGGSTQNSTNVANNGQSIGTGDLGRPIIIGDVHQRNKQTVGTIQSTKKGTQNSLNIANNTQVIASYLILGDTAQINEQALSSSQVAKPGTATGSTIIIAGVGTIKIPGDPLPTIDVPPISINPASGASAQNSQNTAGNSQIILGG